MGNGEWKCENVKMGNGKMGKMEKWGMGGMMNFVLNSAVAVGCSWRCCDKNLKWYPGKLLRIGTGEEDVM